jgi:hypothetical protein
MSTSMAELKDLVADLYRSTKELRESQSRTDRQIKELGKQIGGLGNKFGTFAEGMAFASLERILREEFGMEAISVRVRFRKGEESEEYDILAYSNGERNAGMVVEIKSILDRRAVEQMKRKMDGIFYWMPEHRDKEFQGMMAYVEGSLDAREEVLRQGWHLVRVGEEVFQVETPPDFEPRIYRAGDAGRRG